MATAIQRRRGTTSQHSTFTGLAGEITIDTTKNTVVVHDGSTAGGVPLAKSSELAALGGADITAVVAGDGLSGGSTSGDATINVDLNELTAAEVDVTADSIAIVDATDNSSKKESISDLVAAIAGTGLTATNGQLLLTDTGYVTGVTAGDGLSGGGADGTVTLALDLNELTAAAVDVATDSLALIDGGDNSSKKESIVDLVAAIAGTNLTASSGQLVGTAGTVTSVAGGAGLTGSITTSGSLAVAVASGGGITVNADDIELDNTVVFLII